MLPHAPMFPTSVDTSVVRPGLRGRALRAKPHAAVVKSLLDNSKSPRAPRMPLSPRSAQTSEETSQTDEIRLPASVNKPRLGFKRFHAVEEVKNLSPRLPKPDVFPEEAQLPLYIITRSAQPRLWLDECEGVTNENEMGDKEPLPGWVAEFVDSASVPACFMEDWLRHFTADTRSFASKAVFAELSLRQAIELSKEFPQPNGFVSSLACLILSALASKLEPDSLILPLQAAADDVFHRVFAENDSNPRPVFGARNSTDAIKLFTRQHNATVYHRLLHETTTLKCELDAVKIRHDQLMTKLDRNKISFKSALQKWRFNLVETVFTSWKSYVSKKATLKIRHRAIRNIKGIIKRSMKLSKRCFHSWVGFVHRQKAAKATVHIEQLQRKVSLFQAQLPGLFAHYAENSTTINDLQSVAEVLRSELAVKHERLSHVQVILEQNAQADARSLVWMWFGGVQQLLSGIQADWLNELAHANVHYRDGSVLSDDVMATKLLDAEQLRAVGTRMRSYSEDCLLLSGTILRSELTSSGLISARTGESGCLMHTLHVPQTPLPDPPQLSSVFGVSYTGLAKSLGGVLVRSCSGDNVATQVTPVDATRGFGSLVLVPGAEVPPSHIAIMHTLQGLRQLGASTLMLRWANSLMTLAVASLLSSEVEDLSELRRNLVSKQRVHSFGNDIKDGKALSLLLHAIDHTLSNPLEFAVDASNDSDAADRLHALTTVLRQSFHTVPGRISQVVQPSLRFRDVIILPSTPARDGSPVKRQSSSRRTSTLLPSSPVDSLRGGSLGRSIHDLAQQRTFRDLCVITEAPKGGLTMARSLLRSAERPPPLQSVGSPGASMSPGRSLRSQSEWLLYQAKDVYQGNPTWTSAAVSQLMRFTHPLRLPVECLNKERAVVSAFQEKTTTLLEATTAFSELCGSSKAPVSERECSQLLRDISATATVVAAADNAITLKLSSLQSSDQCWRQAVTCVEDGVWHRIAGIVTSTSIEGNSVFSPGASKTPVKIRRTSNASTNGSVRHLTASYVPSPTAFGRTGSHKLSDLKQDRLAPFASIEKAKITDVLTRCGSRHGDYERVCALLDSNAGRLEVIFSHYAWMSQQLSSKSGVSPSDKQGKRRSSKESAGSPQSQLDSRTQYSADDKSVLGNGQSSKDASINRHQFWRFVKDAGLLNPHLSPADVDHVLLRVCRFDGMSVQRRESNSTTARPPEVGLPRRSSSIRGRRPTLLPQDPDSTPALKTSERIEEQLKIQAKIAAKRVVKNATTHVSSEQFVEALIRLAGYHPSALGTGVSVPLETIIHENLSRLVDQQKPSHHMFRKREVLEVIRRHKHWLRTLFLKHTDSTSRRTSQQPQVLTSSGDDSAVTPRRRSTLIAPPLRRFSSMGATSLMPSARRQSIVSGLFPESGALTTEDGDGIRTELLGVSCTMRITGWIQALTELRMFSPRLPLVAAEKLFQQAQPEALEPQTLMVFAEFCDGLAAAALMLDPSPFLPVPTKIDNAFAKWAEFV